ncbi:hypothetical protein T459_27675 [Capsicum annuum]|uniref:Uncharacterized protein n=1 Tax=Capsicum annuum TaxID=4072 RepID=A0A2G2YEL6_CAPAN|nr:hypothetical protein T459_27675 [Capsicum annuum]
MSSYYYPKAFKCGEELDFLGIDMRHALYASNEVVVRNPLILKKSNSISFMNNPSLALGADLLAFSNTFSSPGAEWFRFIHWDLLYSLGWECPEEFVLIHRGMPRRIMYSEDVRDEGLKHWFEKYDGHGNPVAHLRRYCNQLRGTGGKEELLMAYFRESLSGLASKCMKKKNTESFREYVIRWREQAARVRPPMKESKIVEVFINAQDETYYQHLLPALGKPFIEVLKMGEMIEEGIKTGRIVSFATLKATTQAIQKGSESVGEKKNEEDASTIVVG